MNYLEELNKWYDTIHADNDWASIPIITTIEENLGLTFDATSYDSDQVSSGNVCMAGSPEVRDEFKEIFIENGGENWQLVESLNDSPLWIDALEELATKTV